MTDTATKCGHGAAGAFLSGFGKKIVSHTGYG